MVGINLGDLAEALERAGVPAVLALASIYFLIVYLRSTRNQPQEPDWAADIRRRMDQTDAHVRKMMADCQRANDRHTDQLNTIQGMVQEIRTTVRIRSGQRGGD